MAIDLADTLSPTITSPLTDGLFSAGRAVSGTETVSFGAEDRGGGVYQAALIVDGFERVRQVVNDNDGYCREPFVKRTPCSLNTTGTLSFDTTLLSDGTHRVALIVYDATNVNSATYGPVDVVVDNRPDGVGGAGQTPNGVNAVPKARIVPAPHLARGRVRDDDFRGTNVRGKLVDEVGQPIAGATLAVFSTRRVPGARPRLIAGAKTNDKGEYSFRVPRGPSRRILVAYRSFPDVAGFTAAWTLDVNVPAPVLLRPSTHRLRNGQTLVLAAKVRGRVPARSADVAFQVLIGSQWRTFARRPIDRHGRARVSHRFTVTFQRLSYRFRAITLARRAFPYADGRSRVTIVRVN